MNSIKHIPEGVKQVGDGTAISLLFGAWMGIISGLASLATLLWMCIRIYETKTIQNLIHKDGDRSDEE